MDKDEFEVDGTAVQKYVSDCQDIFEQYMVDLEASKTLQSLIDANVALMEGYFAALEVLKGEVEVTH